MTTLNERLAISLAQLRHLQKSGRRVFRLYELTRTHRNAFSEAAFLPSGALVSRGQLRFSFTMEFGLNTSARLFTIVLASVLVLPVTCAPIFDRKTCAGRRHQQQLGLSQLSIVCMPPQEQLTGPSRAPQWRHDA